MSKHEKRQARTNKVRNGLLVAFVVVAVAGVVYVLYSSSTAPSSPAIVSGEPAPLVALNESDIYIPHPDAQATVIFSMAYWCGNCVPEARALAQLQQEYGDQLQVVVVDIDPTSTPERLQEFIFASTLGTDHLIWAMDRDGSFSRSYSIRALDTTIILDRDGKEIYRDTYPTPYDTLRNELRKVL